MINYQSKTRVAVWVLSCIGCCAAQAQKGDSPFSRGSNNHSYYVRLCIFSAENLFFSENKTGSIQVSFPYSVTLPGSGTSDNLFKSKSIRPFAGLKSQISLINLEAGNQNHFFTAGVNVSFIGDLNGYGFTMGYGRNVYFQKNKYDNLQLPKAFIVFRPSLNLAFTPYAGFDNGKPFYLGTITNQDRQLNVLGNIIPPTYTTSGRYPKTYQAKTLDIYYSQKEWALVPKIAISNNPFRHFLHWEIELAYNIPFSEKAGILLTQNSLNPVKTININDPGVRVLYENNPIKSPPYTLFGFYIGGRIGLNIPSKRFNRIM
jgi:hypothetical protein